MNRNVLYVVIAVLLVAGAVLGYEFYKEQQKTSGIEVEINEGGVSVETK